MFELLEKMWIRKTLGRRNRLEKLQHRRERLEAKRKLLVGVLEEGHLKKGPSLHALPGRRRGLGAEAASHGELQTRPAHRHDIQ